MQTAIRKKYGSPDVIEVIEMDIPTPTPDELLIKVHASTVNRTDCANLTGRPLIMHLVLGLRHPRNPRIGVDFAGEVVAVGANITNYNIGDRLAGFNDVGVNGQGEYLTIKPSKQIHRIPDGIDYVTAVAAIEGTHYAYSFLTKADIQPGQKVLVNGATGAIGSALLQILRPLDIHITATADTPNLELIQSLGADKVIDYTKTDFTTLDLQLDHIFDSVGKSRWGKCKSLLLPNGSYTSSELGPNAENPFLALFGFWTKDKTVHFPIPYSTDITLPFVFNAISTGDLSPVIDRSYPLKDIAEAYRYVMKGMKTGNVLIEY